MPLFDESLDRPLDDIIGGRGPIRRGRPARTSSAPYSTAHSPRSGPARGSVSARHARLVEEVKQWQRSSLSSTGAWQSLCDERGDEGCYDPVGYDEAFLRAALAELQNGDVGRGDGHPSRLAEKVKEFQRSALANTQIWKEYCDEYGDGSYDPNWYDDVFLKAALAELGNGDAARGDKGSGRLSDGVKEFQRSSIENTQMWKDYCDDWGDGSYDPAWYDGAFLKAALDYMYTASRGKGKAKSKDKGKGKGRAPWAQSRGTKGKSKGRPEGGQLTEEVKAFQRAGIKNTNAWRRYCDDHGEDTYDPSLYSGAFLQAFLADVTGRGA